MYVCMELDRLSMLHSVIYWIRLNIQVETQGEFFCNILFGYSELKSNRLCTLAKTNDYITNSLSSLDLRRVERTSNKSKSPLDKASMLIP